MRKTHAKPDSNTGKRPYVVRETVCLVTLLVVVAVFFATMLCRPSAVATVPDSADIYRVAAMNVHAAIQVTPEYGIMTRCPADSPRYRVLYRKARLKVVAAAQYVARKERYSLVLCSPSSELPDITHRVMSTLAHPRPDFFPIAELSDRPFTGEVIAVTA